MTKYSKKLFLGVKSVCVCVCVCVCVPLRAVWAASGDLILSYKSDKESKDKSIVNAVSGLLDKGTTLKTQFDTVFDGVKSSCSGGADGFSYEELEKDINDIISQIKSSSTLSGELKSLSNKSSYNAKISKLQGQITYVKSVLQALQLKSRLVKDTTSCSREISGLSDLIKKIDEVNSSLKTFASAVDSAGNLNVWYGS